MTTPPAHLRHFLAHLENVKKDGTGWSARCPAHEDDRNSLHVALAPNGNVLVHCHAGCETQQIVHEMSLGMSALFPEGGSRGGHQGRSTPFGNIVAEYDYVDAGGALLFQVLRDEHKNFRQRKPTHLEPPADPWTWSVADVRKVLYRLPEVRSAIALSMPIHVVEGEKDADALAKLGLTATTNSGGAGKWTDEHTAQITGASSVIIIPDNDPPGEEHTDKVAKSLVGKVGTLRVVKLPDLPPKGDVSDWIEAGGTKQKLETLAKEAPLYISPTARFTSISVGAAEFVKRSYERPMSLLGDGLFCAGDLAVLYGKPGLGKTWTAGQLALALVRGESWMGLQAPERPCRVGILELELHAFRLQARLKVIAGDSGLTEDDNRLEIVARPDLRGAVNIQDESDWAALQAWCREHKLDVLIVDALSRVHDVEESSAHDFAPVLARLDQLRHETGTAVLLIHHERKGDSAGRDDDMDALRGTSRMASDPNLLIRLVKVGEGGLLALRFPKVNNAETPKPIYLIPDASGRLLVTEAPEHKGDRNQGRVLQALVEGGPAGLTNEDIQRRAGLKRSAVSKHLKAIGAVKVGKKPPRFLPPSTISMAGRAEAASSCSANGLDGTPGQLPFPQYEHLPPSTPSALKGGKADGSWGGKVRRGGTESPA